MKTHRAGRLVLEGPHLVDDLGARLLYEGLLIPEARENDLGETEIGEGVTNGRRDLRVCLGLGVVAPDLLRKAVQYIEQSRQVDCQTPGVGMGLTGTDR